MKCLKHPLIDAVVSVSLEETTPEFLANYIGENPIRFGINYYYPLCEECYQNILLPLLDEE